MASVSCVFDSVDIMYNIIIPDRSRPPADIEQAVFGTGSTILTPCAKHTSEIQDDTWRSVDAILAWHDLTFDAPVIAKLERCRVIVRVGVGFENVDLEAAGRRGICVCNVPDYGTCDVADHTIALLLTLARGVIQYEELIRRGEWTWERVTNLNRLTGGTFGVVGLGRIGTATAMRAKGLGMQVLFYDPYKPEGHDKALGIRRAYTLDDLLSQSDAVSLHCPSTPETMGMANRDFFRRMKPNSYFINTARGRLMDADALYEALESGHLRGAGSDVLPVEPPDRDHPLFKAWFERAPWLVGRFVLTPHAAFFNRESHAEMRRKAAEEALRVLQGLTPRNCVNHAFLR
jgi:lactate dehydrogenase-like 2-hydroxyacid dehydrogenase